MLGDVHCVGCKGTNLRVHTSYATKSNVATRSASAEPGMSLAEA